MSARIRFRFRGGWARGPLAVLLAGTVLSVGAAAQASAAPALPPAVGGISPAHGPEAGGTTVTVTGAHLAGTTAVTFGATPATNVIVVSDSEVTATAPPHAFGTVDVTVTNPSGTSPAGHADQYTYDEPAPAVTGISPAHGPEAGGNTVTVTGLNLASTTAVTFGPAPGSNVTVVDDHTVNVTAPPHTHGTLDVTVTNPSGTSPAGNADRYTYDEPAPAVTALSPRSGVAGGGTTVTITGTDFDGATAVSFGGTQATSFTVNSDTAITAKAPPHAAGPVDVTVTNPAGTSPASSADRYRYSYPFGGFLAPVANPPAVNKEHAGQAIPVQFSLGGNQGLGILAAGYPTVQQVGCSNGSPIGSSAPAGTAGGSGLQYSRAAGTYTFGWKTAKAFAGTCQVFTLGLNDGTLHTANFTFS